jgi:predicted TIM-barrel enzyme
MMPATTILEKFRDMIARGEPIIGGGAGTGLSAKCEEAGGIDLIVIYNSGRYRMAGRGSLAGLMPYGDANAIVVEMASEVLPVVKTRRCWPASAHRPVPPDGRVPGRAEADRLFRACRTSRPSG